MVSSPWKRSGGRGDGGFPHWPGKKQPFPRSSDTEAGGSGSNVEKGLSRELAKRPRMYTLLPENTILTGPADTDWCPPTPSTGSWPALSSWLSRPGLGSAPGPLAPVCSGTQTFPCGLWQAALMLHLVHCLWRESLFQLQVHEFGHWPLGQDAGQASHDPKGGRGGSEQRQQEKRPVSKSSYV